MLAAVFRVLGVVIFVAHLFFVISGEAASRNFTCIVQPNGKEFNFENSLEVPLGSSVVVWKKNIADVCGPAIEECRNKAKMFDPVDCQIAELRYSPCNVLLEKVGKSTSISQNVGCSRENLWEAAQTMGSSEKIGDDYIQKKSGAKGWDATVTSGDGQQRSGKH